MLLWLIAVVQGRPAEQGMVGGVFTEDYERAGRSLFHILSEIPWERRCVEGRKVHVVILGRLQGASIE